MSYKFSALVNYTAAHVGVHKSSRLKKKGPIFLLRSYKFLLLKTFDSQMLFRYFYIYVVKVYIKQGHMMGNLSATLASI